MAVLVPFFLVTGILGWMWLSYRKKQQRRLRRRRGRRRGSTTHSSGNVSRWGPYEVIRIPVNGSDHGGDISRSGSHHVVYMSRNNSHRAGHISRNPSHRSRHSTKHRRRSSGQGHSKPVFVENEAPHEPPQQAPAPAEAAEAVEAVNAPTPPKEEANPPPVAQA